MQNLKDQAEEGAGVLGFLTLFSGGALTQFALFALGIMPYITSSIIMQILTVVIPRLEQWQQQGAVGQRKITQWTRYLTVAIALLQSTGLAFLFHNGGGGLLGGGQGVDLGVDLFGGDENFNTGRILIVVLTLTAGTALLMWMGELITQRGIGNGMSLLIFASVVSSFPVAGAQINAERGIGLLVPLLLLAVGIMVAIVFVELGQRRIPVQFSKRVVGNRMTGGQSTYIPLKVNQSGVIPVIFASSVLYLPLLLTQILPGRPVAGRSACRSGSTTTSSSPTRSSTSSCTACSSSASPTSTRRSSSTRPSRPTPSASRAATSPASGPAPRPSATSAAS